MPDAIGQLRRDLQQPWQSAVATDLIRAIARSPKLSLAYKLHAREQMSERNLIVSDVLFVLKYGFVFDEPTPSTRRGVFRYAIDNMTPNSDSRNVRLIVVPDQKACLIKIVTVMWVDETATRAGSIISTDVGD